MKELRLITVPYNERGEFDLERLLKDVNERRKELDLSYLEVSRETGIPSESVKFAMYGNVSNWRTVVQLAGWAGLWLDEYRQ